MKLKARTDPDGVLSIIEGACPVCGCDPEVVSSFIRKMRRTDDGAEVKVRVGYQDSCGAVIIDGLVQGSSILPV